MPSAPLPPLTSPPPSRIAQELIGLTASPPEWRALAAALGPRCTLLRMDDAEGCIDDEWAGDVWAEPSSIDSG